MTPRSGRVALRVLFLFAFVLYVSTTARTVGWWDDSHYAFNAASLSITNPPGSLLLTVLGWLWTRVLWCPPFAFQLHVLAAILGAATVTGAAWCAMRIAATPEESPWAGTLAGVAAGAWLMTAFHLWTYATQFTPYTLTMLFTALLLMAFLRWWQCAEAADDVAGLVLLALLLGLDVSVHRTNQLLTPGFLMGVLLRRPGVFLRPLAVGAALLAWIAGAATQAGYFVLSARHPPIDMADLHSLHDLYQYVSLGPIGGGFLVNLWPRHAPLVRVQLADWGHFLWTNLGAVTVARVLVLLLAVAGGVALWRRSRRLACALLALFLSAGLGAVLYFNRPVAYMRPLDRHYLPSLVLLAPFVGAGLHALVAALRAMRPARLRLAPAALSLALVCWNAAANHAACDRSHTRYAETYARDSLEPLEPNAILFTNGDNDTFPLLYLQQSEHVRPDVLVANMSLLYVPSVRQSIERADTTLTPILGEHPGDDIVKANAWRRPVYVAVTVPRGDWHQLQGDVVCEGLAERLSPPDGLEADNPALAQFVHERLPRAGLKDRRQIIEPEVEGLLGNYASVGFKLAQAQFGRGDLHAMYVTCLLLQRELDGARLGSSADAYLRPIRESIEQRRAQARALGIEP